MAYKNYIEDVNEKIEKNRDIYINANDSIWGFAETRFREYKSSELLCRILKDNGFEVKKGIAGMETAFIASYGSGKPEVGILGEFDALFGLSQKAGISEKEELYHEGNGHGCGHQALGTGSLAAAVTIKEILKENNIPGTIRYYGCPAEEGGSGKVYMIRAGYFKDLDIALTWHPGSLNIVNGTNCLANMQAYFKFHGLSSHAAASPHTGRSALDAVELTDIGANYLREHIIPSARLHYAITNTGGFSPNVVQSSADVLYLIRAPHVSQVSEIYERMVNVAKGAALMTGTHLEVVFDRACSNRVPNRTLEKLLHEKFKSLGPVPIDEEDRMFSKGIRQSLSKEDIDSDIEKTRLLCGAEGDKIVESLKGKEVVDIVLPYTPLNVAMPGSTDVGDVSWNVPTAEFSTACYAKNIPGHSWQRVAQGKSGLCHKGLLHAGKLLALTALELFQNHDLIDQAKEEFIRNLAGDTYKCGIPDGVEPIPIR